MGERRYLFCFLIFLVTGCSDNSKHQDSTPLTEDPLLTLLPSSITGVDFKNELIEDFNRNNLVHEYYFNGGGVSIGDVNNDGLPDLFFTANQNENRLYLNQGEVQFKDVTDAAQVAGKAGGWSTGSSMVDINNDGLLDIYVCYAGRYKNDSLRRNELYINLGTDDKGIPSFSEQAARFNLDDPGYGTQAAFFDYDRDGDLDVYILNNNAIITYYNDAKIMKSQRDPLVGDKLLQNQGDNFQDVSVQAGIISNLIGFGLGVGIGDFNDDQWPDIYIANDYEEHDYLYVNNGDGTFIESIKSATNHISYSSMGLDVGDINNDGLLDILILDMAGQDNYSIKTSMSGMNPEKFQKAVDDGLHYQYMYNTLQLNNSLKNKIKFSETAHLGGVSSTDWSWGPLILDLDLDGHKDLFLSNGYKRDVRNNDFRNEYQQRASSFKNSSKREIMEFLGEMVKEIPERPAVNPVYLNGRDLTFTKMNDQWGLTVESFSNGAAYGDLDNDGDLDLVVNNINSEASIYLNRTRQVLPQYNYVAMRFSGNDENALGIGVRVEIKHGRSEQIQEHYLSRGYLSSVSPGLTFGLGEDRVVDQLKVTWPDGRSQIITKVPANQMLTINYKDATVSEAEDFTPDLTFIDITRQTGVRHHHKENTFDDYQRESLLPHRYSQEGPALAVGDVNGDFLDDFYIGGAQGYPGKIWVQNDGSFQSLPESLFNHDKEFEDVSALFLDVEDDGDLDLYVVSGGNERRDGSQYLSDRLYLNNGEGLFQRMEGLDLPNNSGGTVKTCDFDKDGDLDLFVGGRQLPGQYPFPAHSYLLKNESSVTEVRFEDVTSDWLPELRDLGMVTDAAWADIDNNGFDDLIIVGEWMPVRIFSNTGNSFTEVTETAGLSQDVGWWYCVTASDLDRDGDMDLVVGNLGLNYKYKATKKEPFEVYAADFDLNGEIDIALGYYDQRTLFPLRGRECSSNQMPFIKNKFPTYSDFGKATLQDVLGQDRMNDALHYAATNFATCFFENDGSGKFISRALNSWAQISSVNAILVDDFNGDSHLDLILLGNLYGSEVETPRNDASHGLLMEGDGLGNFNPIHPSLSGLFVPGESKNAEFLQFGNGLRSVIVAKNQGMVQLISYPQSNGLLTNK